MKKYLVFISIGFELIGAVLVALYAAEYLEERYPTKGLLTMGLIFVVLTGWFIHITYLLKKLNKKDQNGT